MKRAKFIYILTAGTAVVALPAWYYYHNEMADDKDLAKPQLLSTIWDSETIALIGKAYLNENPDENDAQKLISLLSDHISKENVGISASLINKIRNDYKTGEIVTIEGWDLSITEARQCALFALD
ncbi:MAG: hypothetical protein HKN31_00430 [Pricia sp.]|nr:hypothetical protein [Pricia sp.]